MSKLSIMLPPWTNEASFFFLKLANQHIIANLKNMHEAFCRNKIEAPAVESLI